MKSIRDWLSFIAPSVLKLIGLMSVFVILFLFNDAGRAQNARQEVQFIQHGICPFECCQYGKWTARSPLKAFKHEGDDSNVSFIIQPSEEFTAVSGNVHVVKPGAIVINKSIGTLKKGDKVYVLSYRGEGEYDLWFNGKKLDNGEEIWSRGTLKQLPEIIWWVSVINKDGQNGWLRFKNISKNGFETEDKVDGQDSCS